MLLPFGSIEQIQGAHRPLGPSRALTWQRFDNRLFILLLLSYLIPVLSQRARGIGSSSLFWIAWSSSCWFEENKNNTYLLSILELCPICACAMNTKPHSSAAKRSSDTPAGLSPPTARGRTVHDELLDSQTEDPRQTPGQASTLPWIPRLDGMMNGSPKMVDVVPAAP